MLSLSDLAHLLFDLLPWPKGKPLWVAIGVALLCLVIVVALIRRSAS